MLVDKDIEIVQWIKFNSPDAKKEVEKLIKISNNKMEFVSKLTSLGISIVKAMVIAENFYKK